MRTTLLFVAALAAFTPFPARAETGLEGTFWARAAAAAGVAPSVLYGIACQETHARWRDGSDRPWPWTLTVNRGVQAGEAGGSAVRAGPRRFNSRVDAEQALSAYLASGVRDIDVGLMQINLRWHGRRVDNPLRLLDPRTSLAVAASVLREASAGAVGLRQAVGRYHSRQAARGQAYADRVLRYARRLEDGRR
jgi:hypothetical protein